MNRVYFRVYFVYTFAYTFLQEVYTMNTPRVYIPLNCKNKDVYTYKQRGTHAPPKSIHCIHQQIQSIHQSIHELFTKPCTTREAMK